MKSKLSTLLLFLAITVASAQGKKWSLQECVLYAVENNLSVEQFELDLENAMIDKSDAIGNFLPTLNANSRLSGNTGFSINPTNNLPTNTTQNSIDGGITTAVTLYDGLRNVHRLNRAKLNAIANEFRLADLKDDIRLSVATSYLDILSNKEGLKVARAQYKATEQDLKRLTELVNSGVVPRGDLLDIQATAATQEQQIVNTEGNVQLSKIALAQLLQIRDYENFDVSDETFEIPISDILNNSPSTIFAKALEFRNDIKLSEANISLAEKDLAISKGALMPTVGAFFNYGTRFSDVAQIPGPPLTAGGPPVFFTPNFTDQLWIFDGIAYGVQLNIPIFNGFSVRNGIERSKIAVKQRKVQFEQEKLDLENVVNQAYVNVNTFYKSYEAAEKTADARRLAYQYSKERFDVGLLNAFDFTQAQARVDNAEADVVRTKYDYIFRLKILEFYFGLPLSLD
ncbi:TolC family protein [Maribacter antarcticus]|uniref:TolC family protein n=1 Tax=Maribacter antarcticus TaxID=505250 RepID=UPI00047DE1BC|nr:TolC family protein [Maribacter antarcticus]